MGCGASTPIDYSEYVIQARPPAQAQASAQSRGGASTANASGASSTGGSGGENLHDLIKRKNWDGLRARIQSNPGEVRQKDFSGWFPLHRAAYNGAPLDVVRYLVEQYPDGVREKDDNGQLPLHEAAGNAPLDVVRYLVEKYPDSVREKNAIGDGMLPLHNAAFHGAPLDVVRYLVEQYPDSVRENIGSSGMVALHWAAGNAPLNVVRYLVEQYPDGVMQKDSVGNLPLHDAAFKAPLDVMRYLVEQYPDGVREKSNGGSLPLHAVVCNKAANLDVVRCLVEQYPQGVHVRGEENKTPLERAEEREASSEVIALLKQAETAGINSPGAWDVFISHCQRDANAVVMAEALFASFEKRGLRVWLDVKMKKRDVAAMEEGAKNSTMVLAIVTGGGDNPDHAFFRRDFCLQELRWAQSVGASIQPVITVDDKKRVGEFLSAAPSDLQALGQVDWIDMNRGAVQYWEVGVDMLEERLEEARATRQRQR